MQKDVRVVPQKSTQSRVLLPRLITLRAHQKGDTNGESVESENTDGILKYTSCKDIIWE